VACEHFVDCIEKGVEPLTGGRDGLELVRILEAASASLKANGAPVILPNAPERVRASELVRGLRVVHSAEAAGA
jgi:hypothetical protein